MYLFFVWAIISWIYKFPRFPPPKTRLINLIKSSFCFGRHLKKTKLKQTLSCLAKSRVVYLGSIKISFVENGESLWVFQLRKFIQKLDVTQIPPFCLGWGKKTNPLEKASSVGIFESPPFLQLCDRVDQLPIFPNTIGDGKNQPKSVGVL